MRNNYSISTLLAVGLFASACNQNTATAEDVEVDAAAQPAAPSATPTPASSPSDTLVKINDDVITKRLYGIYYTERQKQRPSPDNSPQQQVAALNELTNYVLLAEDATARQLDQREDVKAAIKLQRINLLARIAIQDYLKDKTPSEEELKKLYDERIANKSTLEYKAQHILLKTEDEAKAVIEELNKDSDFSELAKTKSTGPTGPSGGDLGWFDASRMAKPFSEAVAKMEDGSYSKQPVETQFGWHVIKREASRDVPAPEFTEAKQSLASEVQQQTLQEYIKGLRENAKVEYPGQQPVSPEQKPTDPDKS